MTIELPRWKSHKIVQAAKIEEIIFDYEGEGGAQLLFIECPTGLEVGDAYLRKHNPKIGGYYVRYEDGYESYSPAATFESGYERLS